MPIDYRAAFKQWLEESRAGTLTYFDGCDCSPGFRHCTGHVNYWLAVDRVILWPPPDAKGGSNDPAS